MPKAARLDGIPIAFLIDGEGRVAWIGQPPELRSILQTVTSGKWDRAAEAERYRAARAADTRLEEFRAHLKERRVARAMAIARELVEGPYAKESSALRLIASELAHSAQTGLDGIDLDLALAATRRAEALTDRADPTVLAALAQVLFLRGDVSGAVDSQQRAVRLSEPPLRAALQRELDQYLRARVPARDRP